MCVICLTIVCFCVLNLGGSVLRPPWMALWSGVANFGDLAWRLGQNQLKSHTFEFPYREGGMPPTGGMVWRLNWQVFSLFGFALQKKIWQILQTSN